MILTFGGGIPRSRPNCFGTGLLLPDASDADDGLRQLAPDTLVAIVDTLRTLPLLYRVNVEDAELLAVLERQLLDALEGAMEAALDVSCVRLERTLAGDSVRSASPVLRSMRPISETPSPFAARSGLMPEDQVLLTRAPSAARPRRPRAHGSATEGEADEDATAWLCTADAGVLCTGDASKPISTFVTLAAVEADDPPSC